MSNKFEEYTDVLNPLVKETVLCSPEGWTKGELTIVCDGVQINYKLKNEEEEGIANISELLRDLIDELYVRMSSYGDTWSKAIVSYYRENNDLKFNTSFQYLENIGVPSKGKNKPWWKLW